MRNSILGITSALVVLFGTCLFALEQQPSTKIVKPALMWTGPNSKVVVGEFVRVRDLAQWNQVWLRHLGKNANQAFADSDIQYLIDFERFEVIAIFQGDAWNSRGIRFLGIEEGAKGIRIRYEDISYQTSGLNGGGEKVSAYAFAVFPKSDKVFQLEENTQGLKDHPAKWTQRALLK